MREINGIPNAMTDDNKPKSVLVIDGDDYVRLRLGMSLDSESVKLTPEQARKIASDLRKAATRVELP